MLSISGPSIIPSALRATSLAIVRCDFIVVPRENLCCHPVIFQSPDGLLCVLLRRVQKCKVSDKDHVAFILYSETSFGRWVVFSCNGNDVEAFVVERCGSLLNAGAYGAADRFNLSVELCIGTDRQHLLDSSLCNQFCLSSLVFYNSRQPAHYEIERYFIDLFVVL